MRSRILLTGLPLHFKSNLLGQALQEFTRRHPDVEVLVDGADARPDDVVLTARHILSPSPERLYEQAPALWDLHQASQRPEPKPRQAWWPGSPNQKLRRS